VRRSCDQREHPRRRTFTAKESSAPLDGSPPLPRSTFVCRNRMPLWSTLVVSLVVIHRDDRLLRRLSLSRRSTAAFLIRAGLLVIWLQLNVSGFRSVLARGWHGAVAAVLARFPGRKSLGLLDRVQQRLGKLADLILGQKTITTDAQIHPWDAARNRPDQH
jgi:hypothetical protein